MLEKYKKYFVGVNKRYSDYTDNLAEQLGFQIDVLRPMILVFVRACVHYALYEDEFYLQEQLRFLKQSIALFYEKNQNKSVKRIRYTNRKIFQTKQKGEYPFWCGTAYSAKATLNGDEPLQNIKYCKRDNYEKNNQQACSKNT